MSDEMMLIRTVLDGGSLPEFRNRGDAGADIRSNDDDIELLPGGRWLFHTGIRVAVPDGYFLMLCSRSGLAAKNGVECLIAPGIIDSGYRGELMVCLYNTSRRGYTVHRGDRIAQAILMPMTPTQYVEVSELDETERGSGGFGSTGRN